MEQSPPPYSLSGQNNPQAGNQGYTALPNEDYPPPSSDYPPQHQRGFPPPEYQGGYQNNGYPSKWVGYQTPGQSSPPTGQGHPPQGQGHIQQNYNSITGVRQNQPQQPVGVEPILNDRLGLAVCSMFCCVPLGIVALLKSIESRNYYTAGNYVGAVTSSKKARNYALLAIVCGALLCVALSVFAVVDR